jgi:acyl carrier protein
LKTDDLLLTITNTVRKVTSNKNLEIDLNTRFEDIEDWDSLNTVDMEMDLESTLSISFEVGEFGELKDVNSLLDCLVQKLK